MVKRSLTGSLCVALRGDVMRFARGMLLGVAWSVAAAAPLSSAREAAYTVTVLPLQPVMDDPNQRAPFPTAIDPHGRSLVYEIDFDKFGNDAMRGQLCNKAGSECKLLPTQGQFSSWSNFSADGTWRVGNTEFVLGTPGWIMRKSKDSGVEQVDCCGRATAISNGGTIVANRDTQQGTIAFVLRPYFTLENAEAPGSCVGVSVPTSHVDWLAYLFSTVPH
jgi:hypothetical protein